MPEDSSKRNIEITKAQLDALKGFYAHCDVIYSGELPSVSSSSSSQSFNDWAAELDGVGIPWHVQNIVAELAESRSNRGKYLQDMLAAKGIFVKQ